MKTSKLFLSIAVFGLVFASCNPVDDLQTTIVDFENVNLSTDSLSIGTNFISGNCNFIGNSNQFWNGGVVCSAKNDTLTASYLNQYSCIGGSGAFKSRHFGVVYTPASFTCQASINGYYTIKSILVNNSTYAYRDMQTGTPGVSKKFVAGDWFKLSIKGFKTKVQTSIVDFYLADFRNGKSSLIKTWEKVDLSALGQVDSVAFSFDSSDVGQWGINTPTYVCIDNIEFTQTINTK